LIKPIDTLKKVVAYSVPRRKGKTLMLENIAVEAAMDGINTVMVFVTEKLLKDSRDNINARLTQLPE
jgi:hypothetical protein